MKAIYSLSLCVGLLAVRGSAAEAVDYLKDVKPILSKHCYACHGAEKQKAGLRLDTAKSALEGGDSGPCIVVGKSSTSTLIQAVQGKTGVRAMPPGKDQPRLTGQEIATLAAWIDQGAKAPAAETVNAGGQRQSNHWSFQPIKKHEPPAVGDGWARNAIDRFILAKLQTVKLQPSPEADRVTLVRRVSLDLTGLPPSSAEVEAALNDPSENWYEKVVERLLSSPHYGERWGRHWLDQARYADSNGYTIDAARTIWKYRDWVIHAVNSDLPFDRFTIEQLAGDLLPNATFEQKTATGFHRNTLINQEGGIDVEQFRVESVVDRVNTTGSVWLGLTVGCCQCHDHKFDPIAQREYYQLFAFFNNASEPSLEMPSAEQIKRRNQLRSQIAGVEKELRLLDIATTAKERAWEATLTAEIKITLPEDIQRTLALADNSRDNKQKQQLTAFYLSANHIPHLLGGLGDSLPFLTGAHLNATLGRSGLDRLRAELRQNETNIVTTMVIQELPKPRTTNVMIMGDFTRKGVQVFPGTPAVLHPLEKKANPNRLDFAKWLVDPANPLTARVTMNRFWQNYFGVGLVETDNDFGTQGSPPTHPELLDWLANEFIARKWSMKDMHRLIVGSATYRQSSRHRADLLNVDARNRLLARQNRLRLEAEVVRDVALSASGLLAPKVGGPSVFPPQPDGVFKLTQVQRDWKPSAGADRFRRGMYTYFWRSAVHPALSVFDAPDANTTCTRRNRSNTPLQALTLLNDQAYFELAQGLALRVLQDGPATDAERIDYAFRVSLARAPSDKERQVLSKLLAQQLSDYAANPKEIPLVLPVQPKVKLDPKQFTAWTTVARVLMNVDEFITRE
jgi:mono/diheme cytochrome c family protein